MNKQLENKLRRIIHNELKNMIYENGPSPLSMEELKIQYSLYSMNLDRYRKEHDKWVDAYIKFHAAGDGAKARAAEKNGQTAWDNMHKTRQMMSKLINKSR